MGHLLRQEGQDQGWFEEVRLDEEQGRKGCLEEGFRSCQEEEGIQEVRQVGGCREGRSQGSWNQGILPRWRQNPERTGSSEEGQVPPLGDSSSGKAKWEERVGC